MLTCVVLLFYIIKVVAQINQHSNQQLTFKSIGLLVLIIVYYILVLAGFSQHMKACYHTLGQMIILLKHFLCSILDQEFVIMFEKMAFWPLYM